MSKFKSYDRDGNGRAELAKFKKNFFADFPTTQEWKSIKQSIEFYRNWDVAGSGWYHTTYFLPCPFKIGNRLPDKSRIIDHWNHQLMLVFATSINPNGITGKDDVGRTYSISLSGILRKYRRCLWDLLTHSKAFLEHITDNAPLDSCMWFFRRSHDFESCFLHLLDILMQTWTEVLVQGHGTDSAFNFIDHEVLIPAKASEMHQHCRDIVQRCREELC